MGPQHLASETLPAVAAEKHKVGQKVPTIPAPSKAQGHVPGRVLAASEKA